MYNACLHIKSSGSRCKTPALHGSNFCFFHNRLHVDALGARFDTLRLPVSEDFSSILLSLNRISDAIVDSRIDSKRAAQLIWIQQLAIQVIDRRDSLNDESIQTVGQSAHGEELALPLALCEPGDDCGTCTHKEVCPRSVHFDDCEDLDEDIEYEYEEEEDDDDDEDEDESDDDEDEEGDHDDDSGDDDSDGEVDEDSSNDEVSEKDDSEADDDDDSSDEDVDDNGDGEDDEDAGHSKTTEPLLAEVKRLETARHACESGDDNGHGEDDENAGHSKTTEPLLAQVKRLETARHAYDSGNVLPLVKLLNNSAP
jgi:hypothetical protein